VWSDPIGRTARILAGLTAVALLTATFHWIGSVNLTTAGFAYVITILLIAARWGLAEAVSASLAAAFCLNLFFLSPVGTLHIARAEDWVALIAFLVTSLVASQLSDVARRRNAQLEQRQSEMERLYALSRSIMLTDTDQPAGRRIATEIARIFNAPSVMIYDKTRDEIYGTDESRIPAMRDKMTAITLNGRPIGGLVVEDVALSNSALQAMMNLTAVGLEKARTQDLASRAEAARQSEQFKSTLLDAVAHEFKTPLTSIKAATSAILTSQSLTAEQRQELLTIIDQETERLSSLITEAIHLARVESGKLHLSRNLFFVEELVKEALKQSSAPANGRRIEAKYAMSMPTVSVDAELFVLALKQLVDNAAKYSPDGSPIRIGVEASADSAWIRIHNEGPGLSERERSLVFERFYRSPSTSEKVAGTGIGLSIAQDIVKAHGGYLDVESGPGMGTEFSIRLPLAKGDRS
jgi:two-component system sensor histidine kinase KdpD